MKSTILIAASLLTLTTPAHANSGGKAMDCAECAEAYCGGDKTCKECKPLCAPGKRNRDSGGGDPQRTADEDAGFETEEDCE